MKIPYLTRKSKFRIAVLVIAVVCMLVVLIATGCKQSEKAEVSEREQITFEEFFDTENLFLLERIEHRLVADGEKAAVELYTSAQVASDGQMGWDSGDQWTLLVRQGERVFLLYDEYVQYGEVQFWVSNHNPNEVDSPKPTDLESHIYVMVTTDVGFTVYDYVWDAENTCFWKSVSLHPDNQWSTQHSNKYTFPASLGATTATAKLSVSDLNKILTALDLTEATLVNHTETETTYPAKAAIRAESYIEELKSFTWEEYTPPIEWDRKDDYFCQLITNDVTITAFQSGYSDSRPLHLVTDEGEGWFVLPYIQSEPNKAAKQVSWMIYDTFFSWCLEAEAATLYSTGGIPLTAEGLDYFWEYTSSERTVYDEEGGGGYIGSATEISCFFTSQYSDPRDIDAGAFLAYCPAEDVLTNEDEDEFRLVQEKLDWRVGADNHLATVGELPVPCHRLSRTYINEILMQYAGITIEDMNTNWMEEAFYIPQTDCFYTFTSDFGPGEFRPCYGEKNGDILTLWEELNAYDGNTYSLTLQKSGENWLILSRTAVLN